VTAKSGTGTLSRFCKSIGRLWAMAHYLRPQPQEHTEVIRRPELRSRQNPAHEA
jgi:hypothetical protein